MTIPNLKRILYTEDEADIREIVALALGVVGDFNLELCSSGAQTLERAPIFAPDLILLDVMMPKMNGPHTLQALRAQPETANTPVVFMTAKVQASELVYYKQIGALGVIIKPFDTMRLADEVLHLWHEHYDNESHYHRTWYNN